MLHRITYILTLAMMLTLGGCYYLDDVQPTKSFPMSVTIGDEYYSSVGYRTEAMEWNCDNMLITTDTSFMLQVRRVMHSDDGYYADMRIAIFKQEQLQDNTAYPLTTSELQSDETAFKSQIGINRNGVYSLYDITEGWILITHEDGYHTSANFEFKAVSVDTDEEIEINDGSFSRIEMDNDI